MNKQFLGEIESLKSDWSDLFYNTSWNYTAFKFFIRHASFAERLWYWNIVSGKINLDKNMYLVNL